MTIKGLVEAQTRVAKAFNPHQGHMISFGRVRLGDNEDSKETAYAGWTCETCKMLVDMTLIPTKAADILDEAAYGNLK